jgi:hypothetical protein
MAPEKAPHALTLVAARRQSAPAPERENAARAALELLTGRTLSDLEWDRMRARLLEFMVDPPGLAPGDHDGGI